MRKEDRGGRREGSDVAFVPTTTIGPAPVGEQLIVTPSLHRYLLITISSTSWPSHEIRSIFPTSFVSALSTWNPSSRPEHRREFPLLRRCRFLGFPMVWNQLKLKHASALPHLLYISSS
ncbi:hypothetical protein CRG98_014454 [Punica granatum]|uniref:Uncharacterized protein n=1 Tax=Punica granatum TaxID=22663 RepID=A0A2I0KAE9_PUNGR|nr:hypothetical protein CRG98_014454 [Punica granatum]